ncbi:tripartite tricarboxylate transporter substrate binding protein [Cupriavidus sp. P-10]|uniref:Bug family tripartite tricarboxylate transporter substrate binding protein n=1 Tax=Cupriavidus sp. P-10 TaxID=2027911 RepID=UPI000E2E9200|nr:tripartite tricarboxylate transporter substrate-binding protein [Cupriavidus sp. P-10]BDB27819.1 tripartite tricarboxylate transporter substrate binding protein [Cupriavidus sp. P-10]
MPVGLARRAAVLMLMLGSGAPAVAADPYPNRPVKVIVNTAAGGFTDAMARVAAQEMAVYLRQPVVIENKGGADGLIGIRAAKAAPADGYTLLAATGTITQQMALRIDAGYDLGKDFIGVGPVSRSPFLMVVSISQPDKKLGDFISRAKANPGKLTFASAGVGTAPHLATERFLQQAGLRVNHIPYKGNAPAVPDVIGGRVDMMYDTVASAAPNVRGGRLRALAVTAQHRVAALPDVPTFAEMGIANYSAYTWVAFFAPAGTPPHIVKKLHDALRQAVMSKQLQQKMKDEGAEVMDMKFDQFNQFLARETVQAAKLISDLGIPKQ